MSTRCQRRQRAGTSTAHEDACTPSVGRQRRRIFGRPHDPGHGRTTRTAACFGSGRVKPPGFSARLLRGRVLSGNRNGNGDGGGGIVVVVAVDVAELRALRSDPPPSTLRGIALRNRIVVAVRHGHTAHGACRTACNVFEHAVGYPPRNEHRTAHSFRSARLGERALAPTPPSVRAALSHD